MTERFFVALDQTLQTGAIISKIALVLLQAAALMTLGYWAWQLADGSVAGTVFFTLLALFFTWPILAWGVPAVAMLLGMGCGALIQATAALIRRCRARV